MTREQVNQIHEEIREKEQQVRDLTQKLSSSVSSVGDWKVAKCMEYQAMGLDMPYDLEALHAARQDVRDEINTLQEEIASLKEQVKDVTIVPAVVADDDEAANSEE